MGHGRNPHCGRDRPRGHGHGHGHVPVMRPCPRGRSRPQCGCSLGPFPGLSGFPRLNFPRDLLLKRNGRISDFYLRRRFGDAAPEAKTRQTRILRFQRFSVLKMYCFTRGLVLKRKRRKHRSSHPSRFWQNQLFRLSILLFLLQVLGTYS